MNRVMNGGVLILSIGAALAILAGGLHVAGAQDPPQRNIRPENSTTVDPAALGDQLRTAKRLSDDAKSDEGRIPLEVYPDAPEPGLKGDWCTLVLNNALEGLGAVWTFEPVAANPGEKIIQSRQTIRIPLAVRGNQAIALAPGAWKATLLVGRAASGEMLRLPPREITLRRNTSYRLALTANLQHQFSDELRRLSEEEKRALTDDDVTSRGRGRTTK